MEFVKPARKNKKQKELQSKQRRKSRKILSEEGEKRWIEAMWR